MPWHGGDCAVCGSRKTTPGFEAAEEGYRVERCAGCGLGRTTPPVPDDQIGRWYPPEYYGRGNIRFNPLLEILVRLLRDRRARVIRRRARKGLAIDIGCGRGLTLSRLRQYGFSVMGTEISEVAAHHARETLGIDVRRSSIEDLDVTPGSAEVLIFWHSLEHLADPLSALDRAAAILRPGGLLVIAVPNFDSIQARLFGRHWFHLDVPRHYHHFGARSLRLALAQRGFLLEQFDYFSLEQSPYGWIQSALNALGLPFNLLYSLLKRESARTTRLREHPAASALSAMLAGLLLPFSLLLLVAETALRRGGVMEIYARKEAGSSLYPDHAVGKDSRE